MSSTDPVSLFFSPPDIEAMRERAARHRWAGRVLDRIRCGLEADKPEFLAGTRPFDTGRARARAFLELTLCGRLCGDWHREAVETFLRGLDGLLPFMGVPPSAGPEAPLNVLDLANTAQDLCLGLDFLEGVDPAFRARLIDRILRPLGDRLMKATMGGSNIQTSVNLALLPIGLAAGRPDFINRVTSDPERGFPYHLASSVHPDGFWYEQSHGSYHLGTLERLLKTRWIADRNGIALGGDETLRKMLDTVPAMALPGGVLPLIGDCDGGKPPTLGRVSLLELAYAMFGPPWAGWALGRARREDMWSLLVGRDIAATEEPVPKSVLFPQTGLAVLKRGAPGRYWEGRGSGVTVAFGPHGDWHGHANALAVEYRRDGRYLVRDHGHAGGYGPPSHRLWYMSALAHSTLVVDGFNQAFTWTRSRPENESRETGRCRAFLAGDAVSACTVEADFAFPGCAVKRTLFLADDYLLDILECASVDGRPRVFDWLFHTGGRIPSDSRFGNAALACANKGSVPSPPDRPYSPGALAPLSYDFIREVEAFETAEPWSLDVMDAAWAADVWTLKRRMMRLSMAGEAGTTVFKGVCPAVPADVYHPVVLVRRRAASTVFIALHNPGDRELALERLESETGTIACRVGPAGGPGDLLAKREGAAGVGLDVGRNPV